MTNQFFDAESYVSNFLSANKDELIKFSEENGFSFSEDQLIYIQSHFRDEKKALPTYNQLYFFNRINEILLREKRNCAISSVSTKDAEASIILDTAKDLLEKKKLCQKKLFGPTPISHVALTASEYLRYIDCCEDNSYFLPADKAKYSNYYVHLSDNVPLFALADASKRSTASQEDEDEKTAIALLLPIGEMTDAEYTKNSTEFFNLSEIKTAVTDYKTVSNYLGLLEILSAKTNGIFVDLSRIPETEKDENGKVTSLEPLLFACSGRYVFDLSPSELPYLKSVSIKYGLSITVFATRNDSELFILDKTNNPSFCFKFDFIQRLMNALTPSNYIFTKENTEPIGAKLSVFLSDKKDTVQKTYLANKMLSFTQSVACASSRDITNAPYKTAAVATLDAITSLVAKGIPKSAIKLSINYSLRANTYDSTELGKNFAAILGAYRTMIELCVSDSAPQISYNQNVLSITVLASAKKHIKATKSNFNGKESFIYFMPIFYDSCGIPVYQKYRESIKLFYSLFEKDLICSAFYANENISSTIQNASLTSSIEYTESFDITEYALSRGILFESKKELPLSNDLIFIGKNRSLTATEE